MRPPRRSSHRVAILLALAAGALLPWAAALNRFLPSHHEVQHWALAWTGFDLALAAVLLATAACVWRRPAWVPVFAAAATTMLCVDAWFDILTAATWTERLAATALALVAELPLAAICGVVAIRAVRSSAHGQETSVSSARSSSWRLAGRTAPSDD